MKVLESTLKWVLIILTMFVTFSVSWGVFTRYILGSASGWTGELSGYILVWITFIGSAYAFLKGTHIRFESLVDILPRPISVAIQTIFNFAMMAFVVAIFIYGSRLMINSWHDATISLPFSRGFVYLILPLSSILMIIGLLVELKRIWKPDGKQKDMEVSTQIIDGGGKSV